MLNFYLGYCKSDEQVAKANHVQYKKRSLAVKDFFVPLLDDWFIRPLYFVESLDESSLQVLAQAIYCYFGQYFAAGGSNLAEKDLIRVTQSELIFLTVNVIKG